MKTHFERENGQKIDPDHCPHWFALQTGVCVASVNGNLRPGPGGCSTIHHSVARAQDLEFVVDFTEFGVGPAPIVQHLRLFDVRIGHLSA